MKRNRDSKKPFTLHLTTQTIRALTAIDLSAAVGAGQQSNICTQKNSNCNACPE
jgi:hypothetical protein